MVGITCSVVFFLCCFTSQIPIEVKQELAVSVDDPSIQGLRWNKWTTKNFVICSLIDSQGEYIKENVEPIKTWMLTRWGLPDVDFPQIQVPSVGAESICRLICVKDASLFKKLFKLDASKVEVRRNENNEIVLIVGFLLLDNRPSVVLPVPLTEIVLEVFSEVSNTKLNWWTIRGMAILNMPVPDIKVNFNSLINTLKITSFSSKDLFNLDKSQWSNMNLDQRLSYDRSSAALCLMLRRAKGQRNFLWFLKDFQTPSLEVLNKYFGYDSYEKLDASTNKFILSLKDVKDSFLIISPEKSIQLFNW